MVQRAAGLKNMCGVVEREPVPGRSQTVEKEEWRLGFDLGNLDSARAGFYSLCNAIIFVPKLARCQSHCTASGQPLADVSGALC